MFNQLKETRFFQIMKETFTLYSENRVALFGAALAYYTLFSIAPMLVFAVMVAATFFGQEAVDGELSNRLREFFGDNGAESVISLMASVQENQNSKGGAVWIGIIAILFGASKVFTQLKLALNQIWQVKPIEKGMWVFVINKVIAIVMVITVAGLLLGSMIVGTVLSRMTEVFNNVLPLNIQIWRYVDALISVSLLAVLFAGSYRLLPDEKVDWKSAFKGAFLSAFLITLGKFGFSYYLGKGGMASGYGAASSLIVLLVWIYYSAQIYFFGAQLTEVLSRKEQETEKVLSEKNYVAKTSPKEE